MQVVALHEFGHWVWLGDIYGTGGCPAWWQDHPGAVMQGAHRTDLHWDESFGAMYLYGPHYSGFETGTDYWDETEYPSNCMQVSNAQAHPVTAPESGVPVVWDNYVPGMWQNKYLRVSGTTQGTGHAWCYKKLFNMNLTIQPGMWLRWHQYNTNANSRWISIDARFTDGTYLRDYYIKDDPWGTPIHPARRGLWTHRLNEWLWFRFDLDQTAPEGPYQGQSLIGKTIQLLMVGYDYGYVSGNYLTYIDSINIGFDPP